MLTKADILDNADNSCTFTDFTRNALNISAIDKPDYSAIAKDVNNDNSSLLNSEAYSRQY